MIAAVEVYLISIIVPIIGIWAYVATPPEVKASYSPAMVLCGFIVCIFIFLRMCRVVDRIGDSFGHDESSMF